MKTRNPIARSLRSAHLKPKIVRAKKGKGSYRRNKKVAAVDFLLRIASNNFEIDGDYIMRKIIANTPGHKGVTYCFGSWQLRIAKYAVGEYGKYCHVISLLKKRNGEF